MPSFLKYLRFYISASNQHGVHSPFVYALLTQCLYTKQHYGRGKCPSVFLKCIQYFGARRVYLPPDETVLKQDIQDHFPTVRFAGRPYDLLYLEGPGQWEGLRSQGGDMDIHEDSMVLIPGIHRDKGSEHRWEALKALPQITVTVDLFHCGLVFFRKGQAKEHFKIRL